MTDDQFLPLYSAACAVIALIVFLIAKVFPPINTPSFKHFHIKLNQYWLEVNSAILLSVGLFISAPPFILFSICFITYYLYHAHKKRILLSGTTQEHQSLARFETKFMACLTIFGTILSASIIVGGLGFLIYVFAFLLR